MAKITKRTIIQEKILTEFDCANDTGIQMLGQWALSDILFTGYSRRESYPKRPDDYKPLVLLGQFEKLWLLPVNLSPTPSSMLAVSSRTNQSRVPGQLLRQVVKTKFVAMRIQYTTRCCFTNREFITTSLYCKHWSYSYLGTWKSTLGRTWYAYISIYKRTTVVYVCPDNEFPLLHADCFIVDSNYLAKYLVSSGTTFSNETRLIRRQWWSAFSV